MDGKLNKITFKSYYNTSSDPAEPAYVYTGDEFTAQLNPESMNIRYANLYDGGAKPIASEGSEPRYQGSSPVQLDFELLFDGTGVVPAPPEGPAGALANVPIAGAIASAIAGDDGPYDVVENIRAFNKIAYHKDGDIHRPFLVEVIWGKLAYNGALTSVAYNFKLFKPDGTPLRATAQVSFREALHGFLQEAKTKNNSPDLTHMVTVKAGDTLPLLSQKMYGDASLYMEVARINKLVSFRSLKPGMVLRFPPVE
ncbi:MAG: peptidoglycan-binding protein [Bacteroidia bacterium]